MNKWKIGWGVTNLCNMKCSFCYSKKARETEHEHSIDSLKSFVDRNIAYIDSINYGTGENTLSKRWVQLLTYVHEKYGLDQALTTNGTLAHLVSQNGIGESVLNALEEVDISLDFCESQKHCELRGHSKAFDWAIETLKICKLNNIKPTIVILGIDETLAIDNLKGIFQIAEKYNAFVRINIFRPNCKQELNPLSYSVLQNSLKYILANHSIVSLGDSLLSALILNQKVVDPTGVTSLRILPDGSITPSTYFVSDEWKASNINEADLGSSTFSNTLLQNIMKDKLPEDCTNCQIKDVCDGGTYDRRVIWYGGLNKRDPYCPFMHHETLENWQFSSNFSFVQGPKIHDGYLPTLIFAP